MGSRIESLRGKIDQRRVLKQIHTVTTSFVSEEISFYANERLPINVINQEMRARSIVCAWYGEFDNAVHFARASEMNTLGVVSTGLAALTVQLNQQPDDTHLQKRHRALTAIHDRLSLEAVSTVGRQALYSPEDKLPDEF